MKILAKRGKSVVVGALPQPLVEPDVEQGVELLELAPGKLDGLFPDREVLRISRLEFDQLFARRFFYGFVGLLDPVDLAVETDQLGDRVAPEGLAVEQMLPPVNHLPELGPPIADMVVGDDLVPQKACDPGEAVAEDRAADMADMHRLRDIRGAEIQHDFPRGLRGSHPQPRIAGERLDAGCNKGRLQPEIQEPCASHLGRGGDPRDIDLGKKVRRELARINALLLGENHGGIRLVISETRVRRSGNLSPFGIQSRGLQREAQPAAENFSWSAAHPRGDRLSKTRRISAAFAALARSSRTALSLRNFAMAASVRRWV